MSALEVKEAMQDGFRGKGIMHVDLEVKETLHLACRHKKLGKTCMLNVEVKEIMHVGFRGKGSHACQL